MSKGLRPAGIDATPSGSLGGGDPVMQLLICLYCFLAGVAVSTGRMLWLLPLATAASVAAYQLAGAVSKLALPWYEKMPAERAALWQVDLVHLLYSTLTGGAWWLSICTFFLTLVLVVWSWLVTLLQRSLKAVQVQDR